METDLKSFRNLRCILLILEMVTGFKVNLEKSLLFSVGCVPNIEVLVSILGCEVESLPSTYLGLPLGVKVSSKAIWNPIIERMEKRLVLLRSVLLSLSVYLLSMFVAPSSVVNRLEQIQQKFLWQNFQELKKIHLVKLLDIYKPLDRAVGGVGIRSIKTLNRALLIKWMWRFGIERESLWRKVVAGKYGGALNGWDSR